MYMTKARLINRSFGNQEIITVLVNKDRQSDDTNKENVESQSTDEVVDKLSGLAVEDKDVSGDS